MNLHSLLFCSLCISVSEQLFHNGFITALKAAHCRHESSETSNISMVSRLFSFLDKLDLTEKLFPTFIPSGRKNKKHKKRNIWWKKRKRKSRKKRKRRKVLRKRFVYITAFNDIYTLLVTYIYWLCNLYFCE